jgi:predicted nucleic acid-binding protein
MRVLLDTDVILDFLLDRKPFFQAASELLKRNASGSFDGYISSITPINVFYVGRKVVGAAPIRQGIDDLLRLVRVAAVDHSTFVQAIGSPLADYEDAVQHASAVAAGLEAIATRNLDDYRNATLPVYSPVDFLDQLELQQT